MDKVSEHPYKGGTVYFGTKHGKLAAVAAQFSKIGMRCEAVEIDTDAFGTFSGEVERTGSVTDILRKKINAVLELKPHVRFVLASEGSFGPHPLLPIIYCDVETLLFVDRVSKREVFAQQTSTETNFAEYTMRPIDDFRIFLDRIRFPSHGVVVRAGEFSPVIWKGLTDLVMLETAISESFVAAESGAILISSDMRASFNPTRMTVIEKAAANLLEKLTSFCSFCGALGFGPAKAIQGKPCADCGRPTRDATGYVFACTQCWFEEYRAGADDSLVANPAHCDSCNP